MPKSFERGIERAADFLLREYGISLQTGFLPESSLHRLPTNQGIPWQDKHFLLLDNIAHNLPDLIRAGKMQETVRLLPLPEQWPPPWLREDDPTTLRLMLIYEMTKHAYCRERFPYESIHQLTADKKKKFLPKQLAIPSYALSQATGIAPSMSYFLYAPSNYFLGNPHAPHSFDNIEVLHTFSGTEDEKWFIKIHQGVDIILAGAIQNLMRAYIATATLDPADLPPELITKWLENAARSSWEAFLLLKRMREHCDYRTYFRNVRLFYSLPNNLVFRGVKELASRPQQIAGETGGQDPGMHFRLAVLDVDYRDNAYFAQMRAHMPRRFRQLMESVTTKCRVREYVLTHRENDELVRQYNECVQTILAWRVEHRALAQDYIHAFGESHGTAKPPLGILDDLVEATRGALILP